MKELFKQFSNLLGTARMVFMSPGILTPKSQPTPEQENSKPDAAPEAIPPANEPIKKDADKNVGEKATEVEKKGQKILHPITDKIRAQLDALGIKRPEEMDPALVAQLRANRKRKEQAEQAKEAEIAKLIDESGIQDEFDLMDAEDVELPTEKVPTQKETPTLVVKKDIHKVEKDENETEAEK